MTKISKEEFDKLWDECINDPDYSIYEDTNNFGEWIRMDFESEYGNIPYLECIGGKYYKY